MKKKQWLKWLAAWVCCCLPWVLNTLGAAEAQNAAADRGIPPDVVGTPREISVEPTAIHLNGRRQFRHLQVTGHYADGTVRDLTRSAAYTSANPAIASVTSAGLVNPTGDGETSLQVRVGSFAVPVAVKISRFAQPEPFDFQREAVAAFTRQRCNSGACHGTPSGKAGFRLSLQGYLPDQDFQVLSREVYGRRANPLNPPESLILLKGTATLPHEGGKVLFRAEESYKVLQGWIAEGCKPAPAHNAPLAKLVVLPRKRSLRNEGRNQQVVVVAHFADGSQRDVTPLVSFSTSDEQVASVSKSGLVSFHKRGSVAILCRYLHVVDNARLSYVREVPGFAWNNPAEVNYVDKWVFAKLKELQILPSDVCSDDEFLRRAYLDITGSIPDAAEVARFLADTNPTKRVQLIDRLLDTPEYADFWALKWADILRSTRKTLAVRGAYNYRLYLARAFADNRPFDKVVAELLTGSGDPAMNPAANYYRVARNPQDCAETTAQLFLGVRMQCAKCHNHPFERWTQDDYYGFAAFFARVKQKKPDPKDEREIIFAGDNGEVNHLRTGAVMPPKAPGTAPFQVGADEDRRDYLAKWLTSPENPFFAKSVVNRMWFHLFGKGIVDPVDDFRDSNPPCNDELLDALARDFIQSGFNTKQILRTLCTSRVYQLSARTNPLNADDERYFSRAYPKLLTAEQLLDAICLATAMPEKFPGLPLGTRAIQLPDGEINHAFLQAFGQPTRELACECGRESDSTLNQALNLINGNLIHEKLRHAENRIGKLLKENLPDEKIIAQLYLITLSRPATPEEINASLAHLRANKDRRRALEDIHWALLNCKEFLFRH